MDAKEKKLAEETISKILEALLVDGGFELSEDKDVLMVSLTTPDMGVVIGYHGEILDALQLIFSLSISKKRGRFVRVSVEAGDYKKNRSEYLKTLAEHTKERVLADRKEVFLPNLKPWERRIVHLIFQDDPEVVSESVGEGRERTLVVKPR